MPYVKEQRACNRCVRRKVRCDKQRPCHACVTLGLSHTCRSELDTFDDAQKTHVRRRKPRRDSQSHRRVKQAKSCLRCIRRKVKCDQGMPCSTCLRLHVEEQCRYAHLEPTTDITTTTTTTTTISLENLFVDDDDDVDDEDDEAVDQTLDNCSPNSRHAADTLPPSEVIEEFCGVIERGGFIWHSPCVDLDVIRKVIDARKAPADKDDAAYARVKIAFVFAMLAACSALLPAAHELRKRYPTFTSRDASSTYCSQAVALLQSKDRYVHAIDFGTPLLECWSFHLLWWYSSINVQFHESIHFCEQSFLSANMINLFADATQRAKRIIEDTDTFTVTQDDLQRNVLLIRLALDLLYSKSRIHLLLPGSVSDTTVDTFLSYAMRAIQCCDSLSPDDKALYLIRAEFMIKFTQTTLVIGQISSSGGGASSGAEKRRKCLAFLQWIEKRESDLWRQVGSFFYKVYESSAVALPLLEEDAASSTNSLSSFRFNTVFQRVFCFHANKLATECHLLRFLFSMPDVEIDDTLCRIAFQKACNLVSIAKPWSALLRSEWLHPSLLYSAVPLMELSLQILSTIVHRFRLLENDNNSNSLWRVPPSTKRQCVLWFEMNFDSLYTLLNQSYMTSPSLHSLACALKSVPVSTLPRFSASFGLGWDDFLPIDDVKGATIVDEDGNEATPAHPHETGMEPGELAYVLEAARMTRQYSQLTFGE